MSKDYFGYAGKVAVVTGAASGMGKAATEILVDLGAEVYALDFAKVEVPGIKEFIQVNLGEKDSIDAAFAKIPDKIDKFFGIAGISGIKHDYNTTVTVNYIANKYITEEYLAKRVVDGGALAYITSAAGLRWENKDLQAEIAAIVTGSTGWEGTYDVLLGWDLNEKPGPMGYLLSKRAMNIYLAHAVEAFGARKIRVNGVMPAQTLTGLTDDFVAMKGGDIEKTYSTANGYADRFAEAREMAEPMVFLNSDLASFISGQILSVDFGKDADVLIGKIPDQMSFKLLG